MRQVLLNESNRAYWPLMTVNRWLSINLDIMSGLIVFLTAITVTVIFRSNAGLAGLALTSALNLTGGSVVQPTDSILQSGSMVAGIVSTETKPIRHNTRDTAVVCINVKVASQMKLKALYSLQTTATSPTGVGSVLLILIFGGFRFIKGLDMEFLEWNMSSVCWVYCASCCLDFADGMLGFCWQNRY